jgi:hypothetical protein
VIDDALALDRRPRSIAAIRLVSVCFVLAALTACLMAGSPSQASAAEIPAPPGQKDCGDFAGPVWRLTVSGETRGSTGSHYTVAAVNMSCAAARSLAGRMIRKRSPGRGFNGSILPGYTCVSTLPAGRPIVIGGCTAGKNPMPHPGVRGFSWHHCEFVLGTGAHPTCRWKYFTP